MIHYHGTPVSGARQDTIRFLQGRHALVSFVRHEDIAAVADVCQSFVLDSGAFTAWKQGESFNVGACLQWYRHWGRHPGCDWCLIPDVIDGDEDANDELLKDWDRRMWHPEYIKGVPVWHFHESLDRLERLVTGRWQTVALGSSGQWPTPGTNGWWERMAEAMSIACDADGRPKCRLHGLRMLSPEIVERVPFASADSTNVAQNANLIGRFGMYKPPTRSQRMEVIAARIEAVNSPAQWEAPAQQHQLHFQMEHGHGTGRDEGNGS